MVLIGTDPYPYVYWALMIAVFFSWLPYHPMIALWSLQAIADLDKLFAKIVIASADFGLPQGHPGWPEGLGDANGG